MIELTNRSGQCTRISEIRSLACQSYRCHWNDIDCFDCTGPLSAKHRWLRRRYAGITGASPKSHTSNLPTNKPTNTARHVFVTVRFAIISEMAPEDSPSLYGRTLTKLVDSGRCQGLGNNARDYCSNITTIVSCCLMSHRQGEAIDTDQPLSRATDGRWHCCGHSDICPMEQTPYKLH